MAIHKNPANKIQFYRAKSRFKHTNYRGVEQKNKRFRWVDFEISPFLNFTAQIKQFNFAQHMSLILLQTTHPPPVFLLNFGFKPPTPLSFSLFFHWIGRWYY